MMGWGDVSTSPPAKDTFELRPEDISLVVEETREIWFKWRSFGNAVKMSPLVLDALYEDLSYSRDCFREVMRLWLKGTEPKPTWQALITALGDIREGTLAQHLRSKFTVAPDLEADIARTVEVMDRLNERFYHILDLTKDDVKKKESDMSYFFTFITLLPVSLKAQHLRWFMDHISQISRATCTEEIFELLNTYWSILHTSLVHYIVKNYGGEEVKAKLKEFEKDVDAFRRSTPIYIFWRVWPQMELKEVPTDIMEYVRKHRQDWPQATLEDLEQFRNTGFIKYSLPELALMIKSVMPVVL
jgi:hypothetical protein